MISDDGGNIVEYEDDEDEKTHEKFSKIEDTFAEIMGIKLDCIALNLKRYFYMFFEIF